jgi:hypothetical protein
MCKQNKFNALLGMPTKTKEQNFSTIVSGVVLNNS